MRDGLRPNEPGLAFSQFGLGRYPFADISEDHKGERRVFVPWEDHRTAFRREAGAVLADEEEPPRETAGPVALRQPEVGLAVALDDVSPPGITDLIGRHL